MISDNIQQYYLHIGQKIDHIRHERGLTVLDMSVLLGLSRPHLSRIINGYGTIAVHELVHICKVLDRPLDHFVTLNDPEPIQPSV